MLDADPTPSLSLLSLSTIASVGSGDNCVDANGKNWEKSTIGRIHVQCMHSTCTCEDPTHESIVDANKVRTFLNNQACIKELGKVQNSNAPHGQRGKQKWSLQS